MDRVAVIPGIVMPFFPMRPVRGPRLQTKADVLEVLEAQKGEIEWVAQPKLNDDRVTLAVRGKKVLVQNRHGGWYAGTVRNLGRWAKLWDRTVLDGGVYDGKFYAFECLALFGQSMLQATTLEREICAMQMSRLCGVEWLFERPTRRWLSALSRNAPQWEGVVLKRIRAPYQIAGSATQESTDWVKRRWC